MSSPIPDAARPRVSVAVLVRDTEAGLAATLESVQGLADETLALGLGSGAAAIEIARRSGATAFEAPWNDDLSAARNQLLARTTGDWILWLDAGERLAPSAAAALRARIDDRLDATAAYMLLVVAPPARGAISGEQVARIRLVPRRAELRFEGRVRESLGPSLAAAGMRVEGLPWRILLGAVSPAGNAARAQQDLRLIDLALAEEGRNPRLLAARGEALAQLGDPAALAAFAEARLSSEDGSTTQREAFYGMLTALGADAGTRDALMQVALEALEIFPLDAQFLCAVGGYLQAQGRLDLAARSYATAYQHGQVDPQAWHVSDIHEVAAICWSLVLQAQHSAAEARRALEAALVRFPRSTRVRRHFIELCVKHDDRRRALEEVDRLPDGPSHREALRTAVRGGCLAAKQDWNEAIRFLHAAYDDGCRDILCLRWLTTSLVAAGRRDEAVEIVHEWQAVEPDSEALRMYRRALDVEELDRQPAAA